MPNKRNFLNEIKTLDDIEEVENEISKTGRNIINISHWNPSTFFYKEFTDMCNVNANFGGLPEFHNYVYSYYLDEHTKSSIKQKLGDLSSSRECLITPSGTISIQCLLDFAKYHLKIHNMVIINPSYFSVHHACRRLNIAVQEVEMVRTPNGDFMLNRNKISGIFTKLKKQKFNYGLWITNPIYCSGVTYTKEDIDFLKSLFRTHSRLSVFADESFAYSSSELLRDFNAHLNFFSIHDPWKQLCLNGYKFSTISYNRMYQKHFEEWADILYGSLPSSSVWGISLFVSSTFDKYKQIANNFYEKRLRELDQLYGKQQSFSFDRKSQGPYTSCYFSAKNYSLLSSAVGFLPLISQTGLSLIPNERNRFPSNLGFSFRINLAKYDGDAFWENFDKLWKYINNL